VIAASTSEPLPEDTEKRMLDFTDLLAAAIANADSHTRLKARVPTRVEALGGGLQITSPVGAGTSLLGEIPIAGDR